MKKWACSGVRHTMGIQEKSTSSIYPAEPTSDLSNMLKMPR